MAEYIERTAAIEEIDESLKHVFVSPVGKSIMDKVPAADVRPVVLCKDCEYSYDSVGGWCCSHGICVDCIVREDFFCADGMRAEPPKEEAT